MTNKGKGGKGELRWKKTNVVEPVSKYAALRLDSVKGEEDSDEDEDDE